MARELAATTSSKARAAVSASTARPRRISERVREAERRRGGGSQSPVVERGMLGEESGLDDGSTMQIRRGGGRGRGDPAWRRCDEVVGDPVAAAMGWGRRALGASREEVRTGRRWCGGGAPV